MFFFSKRECNFKEQTLKPSNMKFHEKSIQHMHLISILNEKQFKVCKMLNANNYHLKGIVLQIICVKIKISIHKRSKLSYKPSASSNKNFYQSIQRH